jgi:membrane fusion protein (multidrug efflux system)
LKSTEKGAFALMLFAAVAGCTDAKKAAPTPPPPGVVVAVVQRRDVPLYFEAVGTMDGYDNADIRARVRGFLLAQGYKDGAAVKKGQTLFTIDPSEYEVAVASARATLARAKVAQARNKVQLERDQGLFKTGMISQQDLDNVAASVADADAQVQEAQSQVRQAELNLSYTRVVSPIDGTAGLALVHAGNLVGQDGPTLLTTVSQVDPIRIDFPMSENDFVKYQGRFKNLDTRDLAWARAEFARATSAGSAGDGSEVEVVLSDGTVYPHRGVLVTANRQVDPSAGTITLQVLAPNPDGLLRPGQYARVRLRQPDAGHDVVVVPEKALIPVQGTYSVGVVGSDDKVQLRRVEVGSSAQGVRIVTQGLAEGERIVVDGVQKISDGALVAPKPAPAPAAPPPASSAAAKN